MRNIISVEVIATKILEVRGRRVMLDRDLAELYGVSTKALNQAVKRNIRRFPEDFMFRLTEDEKEKVVTICDHLKNLKFSYQLPYVFTPLESPAIYSGVDSKSLVVSRSKIVNPAGQRAKFERGLKPRSNFLTEFTIALRLSSYIL